MLKKVLFDHSIFLHQRNGGISKYICELNKNLIKKKFNSTIFSPISINENLNFYKVSKINFFKLYKIPNFCTKFFYLVNDVLTFFFILFKKPSLIHLTYYNTFLAKLINIPFTLTVYDLTHEKLKLLNKKFDKKYLINKASKIICISKSTRDDLIKYYKVEENKIKVIYLGVNQKKIVNIRKKKIIIYIGARDGYKNFKNFIKAYSRSDFLKKNYKILCFGYKKFSIDEEKKFKYLKIENKIQHISGDEKKLNKIYSDASLLVYPSLYEGFGLPPLEAMRCGCLVASSNIKTIKEVCGDVPIFFNPKNIIDIKQKLEKILKSPILKKEKIKKGYKRIKKFKWEKCATETMKVYKSIN